MNSEKDQNKLRFEQKKHTKEGFDDRLRDKLIDGTGDLNNMENKLIDIERQGEETNVIMQGANMDLRGQRDIITGVDDKNKNVSNNLK